jgi:SNF2 family DNA or RNA helicase
MHTLTQLRTWQLKAADILVSSDYQLLGAQPGSGKTITTLTALARQPRRSLLVAPQIILDTVWPKEASQWEHTSHLCFDFAHRLSGADRAHLWFEGRGDVVTCTPDTLHKFLNEIHRRAELPVARLVIDESQFFKNAEASRTAALHALAEHIPTWLLSGTPSPNGVIDCWSPGRILSRKGRFWQ